MENKFFKSAVCCTVLFSSMLFSTNATAAPVDVKVETLKSATKAQEVQKRKAIEGRLNLSAEDKAKWNAISSKAHYWTVVECPKNDGNKGSRGNKFKFDSTKEMLLGFYSPNPVNITKVQFDQDSGTVTITLNPDSNGLVMGLYKVPLSGKVVKTVTFVDSKGTVVPIEKVSQEERNLWKKRLRKGGKGHGHKGQGHGHKGHKGHGGKQGKGHHHHGH